MIGKRDNNLAKISSGSSYQILRVPQVRRRVHYDLTKDKSDANAQYILSMSPKFPIVM